MRLFAKFFLCAAVVISGALLVSGYLLIVFSYDSAMKREIDRAVNQFQYDKFTAQVDLLAGDTGSETGAGVKALSVIASELSGTAAFYSEDRKLLYSDFPEKDAFFLPADMPSDSHVMRIQRAGNKDYITVLGKLTQSGASMYLLVATDISGITAQKELMTRSFGRIYFCALLVSMAAVLALSILVTKPLKKMNEAASGMAQGRYSERLPVSGGDEIGELSESFNLMAGAVEDKVKELTENARRREDFTASFAHELKTPLTSVIGYADMLFQKAPPGEVRDAAWYILNEGMRLESLSLKLMDLIILGKRDFTLAETRADELIADIAGGLKPLFEDRGAKLIADAEPCYVMVEYDLFKTLLLNLVDNSLKAGSDTVWAAGAREGDGYAVSVADNGAGIPQEELSRITEAFYTVDKSRSRGRSGMGLGLALAEKIADIHGGSLEFKSAVGKGTTVKITLKTGGGGADD